MSKTLIIDGSNLWNRAYYMGNSQKLNPIFLFLRMLKGYCDAFSTSKVICCWDLREEGAMNKRKEELDAYKATRPDRKSVYDDFPKVKEITEYLGVRHMFPKRFEADDIIYYLATQKYQDDCIVITRDTDLFQLACNADGIEVYEPVKKIMIDKLFLMAHYHVESGNDFIIRKALKGDTSDNISGLYIKEDKIAKIIEYMKQNSIDDCPLLNEDELFIFKRNLKLMKLDRIFSEDEEMAHYDKQLEQNTNRISADSFKKACEQLNFQSILKHFDKWINSFSKVDIFDLINGSIFDQLPKQVAP